MTQISRADLAAKEAILNVLTDEETARVSTAEAAVGLHEGGEYIDLNNLDKGVQHLKTAALSTDKAVLSTIIPKSAVSKESWDKIVAHVSH